MDKAANRWIPAKVSPDEKLPVALDSSFVAVKQKNYYIEDTNEGLTSVDEENKSANLDTINFTHNNGARIFSDETTSLPSSVRINHRAQIDVIDMREEITDARKHILIYEEQYTKLIILRALRSVEPVEVASQLVDIVTTIGAPRIIQSGNGRDYAEQVVRELRLLLRDFCVVHGDATSSSDEDRRDFTAIIKSWMKNNPGRAFNEALRYVQVAENTTVNSRNGKIPSQLFFGRNICEDLRRTIGAKAATRRNVFPPEDTNTVRNDLLENSLISQMLIKDDSAITSSHNCNPSDRTNESSIIRETIDKLESDEERISVNGEKYFDCKTCPKRCTKLGSLRNHVKIHERIGNFACALCHESFGSSSLRDKHARSSHEKKIFENDAKPNDDYSVRLERKKDDMESDDRTKNGRARETDELSVDIHSSMRNMEEKKISPKRERRRSLRNFNSREKRDGVTRITKTRSNPNLVCAYCEQKFNFPSVLKRHMRSHTNERPYVCQLCKKSFKQLGHLSQHSLTHTDYRSFQCTICTIKFDSPESLKLHSHSHKDTDLPRRSNNETRRCYVCDICKKIFTTKSVLERHLFTHTHERKFACKICGKRFKQAGHVKSHMLVHTGERKFSCTICAKRFSLSNSLKKHMYVHNGEKPYQCDVCGSRFLEKRNLNGHLMTHTNERPFSCKICGKRYTLADTLRRHISAAHEDGRTYQCEICAKMFKQLAHLSVHKKVHNDERPFQCHLCEKNFKHKNVLKSHLAIHANLRPFECDACKATFVRKTNLQTHIASAHMNERPYTCTICNKRFKQISHLNGHIVVHSNSMPYQCDFCDRRCNRLDNLKKHMRLHTKSRE